MLTKQRVEIPLGVGIERKTQDYVGEPAHVQESENTIFFEPGSAKKRRGELQVGSTLSAPARVLVARNGQLGVASYDAFRYYRAAQADFAALVGPVAAQTPRAVPCLATQRKVRGDMPYSSAALAAITSGRVVYAWIIDGTHIGIRVETLDGQIVMPDWEEALAIGVSLTSSSGPQSQMALVANGVGKARVLADNRYLDVDALAGTVGTETVNDTVVYLASATDPSDDDNVYTAYYDDVQNRYEVQRIDLTADTTLATANIALGTALGAATSARLRMHVGSDGRVWVFTTDDTDGFRWSVTIYTAALAVSVATTVLTFSTYSPSTNVHDVVVAEEGTAATTVRAIAQHQRVAGAWDPTVQSSYLLEVGTIVDDGTPAFTSSGPPIPNARVLAKAFSLLGVATRYPFFFIAPERDVPFQDATYSPGTSQDFVSRSGLLVTPAGSASTAQTLCTVARFAVDLDPIAAVPMTVSATDVRLAFTGKSQAGTDVRTRVLTMQLLTLDFDPTRVPSVSLGGTYFGLAHQHIWSGAELVDGACPVIPGPPALTVTAGTAPVAYRYKIQWEWEADDGALVRSHESPPSAEALADFDTTGQVVLRIEKPPGVLANGYASKRLFVAIYRTEGAGTNYKLVARSNTLADHAADGCWTYTDTLVDSGLGAFLHTTGGKLTPEPPPPFRALALVSDRVWAVSGQDDHDIWPSLLIEEDTAPEFNAALMVRMPAAIVAVEELAGRPLLLGPEGVWTVYGAGPSNTGQGEAFQAVSVSTTTGAISAAACCRTPQGVVFRGRRGMFLVQPDMQVVPWGVEVDAVLLDLTVTRIVHVEPDHQVRVYTSEGTVLVHDYLAGQWSTWTSMPTQDLLDSEGTIYRLEAGVDTQPVWREDADLPSSAPTTWVDVGSPAPGSGGWRGLARGRDQRLHSASTDGFVGYRDIGAAWVTQQLVVPDLWLDSSSAPSVDLDSTPQWNDVRGNGKFIGWDNTAKPVYPAAITAPSGLPVIDCNQIFASPSTGTNWGSILPSGSQYTGYAVIRVVSSPAGSLSSVSASNDDTFLTENFGAYAGLRLFSVSGTHYVGWWHWNGSSRVPINKSIAINTWALIAWWYDGTNMNLVVNGSAATPVAVSAYSPGSVGATRQRGHTGSRWYEGEIRFWANLLTAAQRTAQEAALAAKWGV